MLKSHTLPSAQNTVADSCPPTTQEIAQAIASLEARKNSCDSSAVQASTVTEIIDNLGLDMTAEDVLTEVRAQRTRQSPLRSLPPAARQQLAVVLAVGAIAFFGMVCINDRMLQNNTSTLPNDPALSPSTLVQDTANHAVLMKTLAEIPDNHPVQCGITDNGTTTLSGPLWTLVKHGGKVYLRCWTVPMSARALSQVSRNTGLLLFQGRTGRDGSIRATAPLTLAADSITLPTGNTPDSASSLDAFDVRLDSHAHETWTP